MWGNFLKNEEGVSQVIGATLMVGMTVILVSFAGVAVLGFGLPANTPQAKIVITEAEGYEYDPNMNSIVLRHKGGEALIKNDTKVIIRGRGYIEYLGGDTTIEDIKVTYSDLTGVHITSSEIVEGNTWDAGESITLYGSDEDGDNTVDIKWKLEPGSTVLVTIIYIPTSEVIATSQAIVKQA